jgi:tRNA-(ms[2]io[6]A)-hydroxylase
VAAKVRQAGISTKKSAIFDLALTPLIYPLMLEEQLSEDTRNILGLQLPTDPRWVDLAGKSIEEILTDHAYCEQKAATTCISLIQRYSEREKLVKELAPIVTEEWGHFRLVLQELEKRNLKLGKQRKDEYVTNSSNFRNKAVVWKAGCWINY